MSYLEHLPDKWKMASDYRNNKYRDQSLKDLRGRKDGFELCLGCEGFRVRVINSNNREYVLTSCIFINKCIKQYPHKIDNKEFK